MFRHDRPQAGRYRQFTQFGVEEIGQGSGRRCRNHRHGLPALPGTGPDGSRPAPQFRRLPEVPSRLPSKLLDFFADKKDQLCDDCNSRLEKNPLRVLDCKEDGEKMMKMGVP